MPLLRNPTPLLANFVRASWGPTQGAFSLPSATFTRFPLTAGAAFNQNGIWDNANHWYLVPSAGWYLAIGWWRGTDGTLSGVNVNCAIQLAESDGPGSRWQTIGATTTGTQRPFPTATYLDKYNAGDKIRLVGYADSAAGPFVMTGAQLQIYQAG